MNVGYVIATLGDFGEKFMSKDVTTITRYFILLVVVFILWLFLLHHMIKYPNVQHFFGIEQSSL